MINRSKAPEYTTNFDISLGEVYHGQISTGQDFWKVPSAASEITRIDIMFPSGRRDETMKGQSRLCIKTVTEGSEKMSRETFNEKMDFYGAVAQSSAGMDYTSFSLIVLKDKIQTLLPIWLDMILSPTFPSNNIGQKKNLAAEHLKRELAKNSVIAYRELSAHVFGANHPYGYNTEPRHYQSLDSQSLSEFYKKNISIAHASFIISGYDHTYILKTIEAFCDGSKFIKKERKSIEILESSIVEKHIIGAQDNQSSLRMGRRLFKFGHKDGRQFQLLNLVLGGYFGSRLIKNIREEKGFCYHIDSSVDKMMDDGYFSISADISPENVSATKSEIINEINILRTQLIPKEEFRIVKNYLKGQLLTFIDGPFAKASIIRSYLNKGYNPMKFNTLSNSIEQTSQEDLLKIAKNYLDPADLNTIVVGKQNIEE